MSRIEPICTQNLLILGRAFAQHRGISTQTAGRYIHGTFGFFEKLEAEQVSLTVKTYDKMMARFREQWPEGAPWPKIREPFKPSKPSKPRRP